MGVSLETFVTVEAPLQILVRITHDCPPFPGLEEETCLPFRNEPEDSRPQSTARSNPLCTWRRALRGICLQGTVWEGWRWAQRAGTKCARWAGREGVGGRERSSALTPTKPWQRSLLRPTQCPRAPCRAPGVRRRTKRSVWAPAELGTPARGGLQRVSSQL